MPYRIKEAPYVDVWTTLSSLNRVNQWLLGLLQSAVCEGKTSLIVWIHSVTITLCVLDHQSVALTTQKKV